MQKQPADFQTTGRSSSYHWWRGAMAGAIAMGWLVIVLQFLVTKVLP